MCDQAGQAEDGTSEDALVPRPPAVLLAVPMLIVLLPGLAEFTAMLRATLSLKHQAARAAEMAAVGAGVELLA